MILINTPIVFLLLLDRVRQEYEEETKQKISILNYENTFLLSMYGESIGKKLETSLMFKEKYNKASLEDVLSYLVNKYNNSQESKGFIEDENNELGNKFKGFEEFVVLNKSMFYISSLVNKQMVERELFEMNLLEKEILKSISDRRLFDNILFNHILSLSAEQEKYSSIQFRVQDSYFLYANMDSSNLEKLWDLRINKLNEKIKDKEISTYWVTKLDNYTNIGIDWKILNNVCLNLGNKLFKKQRVNDLLTVVDNTDDKKENEKQIIFDEIDRVLENIDVTLHKLRRYKGFFHYNIFEQGLEDLFDYIKQIKKLKNNLRTNQNANIAKINISDDFLKRIADIEKITNVSSLEQLIENKITMFLPIKETLHYFNMKEKLEYSNLFSMIHKIISISIFSAEQNPNGLIYNCEYQLITKEKEKIAGVMFSFEYSDEFGTYLLKKLEKEFVNLIDNISELYLLKYDESSMIYKNSFKDFMKKCNSIILENKMLEKSLMLFDEDRKTSGKRKI